MSDTILIKDAVQTFYHTAESSARTQGTIIIGRKKEKEFSLVKKDIKRPWEFSPFPNPRVFQMSPENLHSISAEEIAQFLSSLSSQAIGIMYPYL